MKTVPASAREPYGTVAAIPDGSAKPSPEAVRAQLDKILASHAFRGAERPGRFLRFVVEQALGGNHLKETLVGVEVFGRKPAYDPRLDGVVRVEAVKLRSRLKAYYETEGAADSIRIDLPKGGYLPCFAALPDRPAEEIEPIEPIEKAVAVPPRRAWWTDWRAIAALLALVLPIAGYLLERKSHPRPATPDSSSIAVLPFVNLSSDKENEYFSDGLTEDLIDALAKVRGLRVVARGSAFQFKGKNPDIRAVGRQLNVAAVLEGSVQRSGDRLRITAQLSGVADGYHVWSETYDRRLADVFAVQDEISRAIVGALEVRAGGDPGRRLVQSSTQDLGAYNLYLQGRFHLNKWRPEGARKGVEYFAQAIAKDPRYAPAYTGMADCYTWLAVFGWSAARQAMPQARQAANHALELDETLAAAHVSLGYVKALYDWDWPGAEREFKRALELKWTPLSRPNLAGNKLTSDGSESACFGAVAASQPPLPFRRSNRRSGRIPAEPYPPFEFLHCSASHSGPKALNPRGSGTESPISAMLLSLLTVRPSRSSPCQVDCSRRPVIEALVQPFLVIETKILFNPGSCLRHRLVVLQVHLLVFERAPQPFNENVVHAASSSVHADTDLPGRQFTGELFTRELRTLIGVEYLRLPTAAQGALQRLDAEVELER
jgi:TolB-like protein